MNSLPTLRLYIVATFLLAATLAIGAEERVDRSVVFSDGSTIVFLGDSITYQAHFAEYFRGFVHTRYPDRRVHFVNAGIPGETAGLALTRFDYDVARFHPTAVFVMFGMNDGGYKELDEGNNLANYQEKMTELVQRIHAIGAVPILVSPTPFDAMTYEQRRTDPTYRFRGGDFSPNYNYLLAYYGAWCRDLADRENALFLNAYGPMNDYLYSHRLTQPGFTLMPDAIHPDPAGHFLMALSMISDLRPDRVNVGSIILRRHGESESWDASASDVETLELESEAGQISFQARARAIPWVIPAKHTLSNLRWKNPSNGRSMYAATNAGHELSAEVIRLAGLPPGRYAIGIDGVEVVQATDVELDCGVEIQENERAPHYQQSIRVAELNRQLSDEVVRPLRDLISRRVRAVRWNAKAVAEFDEKHLHKIESLEQKRAELEDQIHEAAQTRWQRFEIRLMK